MVSLPITVTLLLIVVVIVSGWILCLISSPPVLLLSDRLPRVAIYLVLLDKLKLIINHGNHLLNLPLFLGLIILVPNFLSQGFLLSLGHLSVVNPLPWLLNNYWALVVHGGVQRCWLAIQVAIWSYHLLLTLRLSVGILSEWRRLRPCVRSYRFLTECVDRWCIAWTCGSLLPRPVVLIVFSLLNWPRIFLTLEPLLQSLYPLLGNCILLFELDVLLI